MMTHCCYFWILQRTFEHFHYHLNFIYLFIPDKSNLWCPHIFGCVPFHWSVVDFPESILLEKTDYISPSNNHFPKVPWLWVGFLISSSIFMVEFGLTLGLVHAVMTTLINTCSCLDRSKKLNFLVIICLCFFNSSSSFCAMIPKL